MTPTDLIPSDTLAALPAWSSAGLQAVIASKLEAAADAMRWDWIPPGEEFSLSIRVPRALLPNDSDAVAAQVGRLYPDWRLVVHWGKGDMEIEFFPVQGFVAVSVPGHNLSGDLTELTVAELKAELEALGADFNSGDRKAELVDALETALGR